MHKRTYEWNVCFAIGQVGSFGFQKVGASAEKGRSVQTEATKGPPLQNSGVGGLWGLPVPLIKKKKMAFTISSSKGSALDT